MKHLLIFLIVTFFAGSVLSQQKPELQKLVETERAFARMALEKSTKEAFLHFLADDGVVFEPTAINGKEAWSKRPPSVGLLSWEPVWADIDASGTLGYTTGPWEFRPAGKDGDPVAFGHYLTIWKKQRDGDFRAVVDIGVSHGKHEAPARATEYPADAGTASEGVSDAKAPVEFGGLFPKQPFSSDAIVYRDGEFPARGLTAAARRAKADAAGIKRASWSGIDCDGSGEIYYCYTRFALAYQDGREYCGNHLRIWKFREGKWQTAVDLIATLPECTGS
ncbi:MAG: nuclear transport factor 2 family protein [Acidobacteriota bacterium]|nr:MAG: nuclear transport factor 2 family protein [Acidobacteriota bacterium]